MRKPLTALLATLLVGLSVTAYAKDTLTIAYAGSMGVVMDRALGPAFARTNDVTYQGIGRGAWGLARLLAGKQMRADVFISITPGPIDLLISDGLIKRAVPIASTQMVIAYSPKSRYAAQFKAAAEGKKSWYKILEQPGVHFGRTNPAVDPQGRNIIFTLLLAQRYYHRQNLANNILHGFQNPQQIFSEASLLSRLEAGQIDATSGYLSAVVSRHLPYIKLPTAINLSDPALADTWYSKAHFNIRLPNGKTETLGTQPLVFYAGVLTNARHPILARHFLAYLQSPQGQRLLREKGYSAPRGAPLG
ncbi:extracellular solute-binding protein [Acidihalobacter ferrooxydans]|uniref:ABC transporter substrate-binding protein n=1 Tax=Acidihalobacter ferrooxydans TaxID=1765967 RepID=A0A1P8UEI2_9GAMM|nr:extracellular solute-binding protein [Acidihalobacter ferrooxydans]APZ42263.1 ABC transporter substrate-binding protein [Acidihalobacter ferrooxydans]